MALIHDIGEGLVGDFTPHCKITYFIYYVDHNRNLKNSEKQLTKFYSLWAKRVKNITCLYGFSMNRLKHINHG